MKNITKLKLIMSVFSVVLLASFAAADVEVHLAGGSSTDGDVWEETVAGLCNTDGTVGEEVAWTTSKTVPRESPEGHKWISLLNNVSMQKAGSFSYSWTTLDIGATELSLGDDQLSSTINLGFNTVFYGTNYNQIKVSSNGFLTFDTSSTDAGCCSGQDLPNPTSPNNIVVGWWEDLLPASAGGSGTIKYESFGVSPNMRMVVEFNAVQHYAYSDKKVTFQIVLKEN